MHFRTQLDGIELIVWKQSVISQNTLDIQYVIHILLKNLLVPCTVHNLASRRKSIGFCFNFYNQSLALKPFEP